MKNIIRKLFGIVVLLMGPVVIALAQPQPPDPGSNASVISGGQALNCPVGNGYFILLGLAFGYGLFKIWQMRKQEELA